MNKTILYDILPDDPVIFEIGAHHGEDTSHFRYMFPRASIHAFEPDERCLRIIKNLHLAIHLYEGVMSDVYGSVEFFPSYNKYPEHEWDGSGSILQPTKHKEVFTQVAFDTPYKVPSVTLHTYMLQRNVSMIDFIWADVQGAEEKVIIGGIEEFRTKVRYFYTEYCQTELYLGCPNRERILSLLPNYSVVFDTGGDVVGDMLLKNEEIP